MNDTSKMIDKYNPKTVYIMTNRINELTSLTKYNNIYFFTDFDYLKSIDDNYYLFCIENNIMNNAKIRCSTFNINKNKTQDYYHDYLTDHGGWQ